MQMKHRATSKYINLASRINEGKFSYLISKKSNDTHSIIAEIFFELKRPVRNYKSATLWQPINLPDQASA